MNSNTLTMSIAECEQSIIEACLEETHLSKKIRREEQIMNHFGDCGHSDLEKIIQKLERIREKKEAWHNRIADLKSERTPQTLSVA